MPRSLQDEASCAAKHIVDPLSPAHCGSAVPERTSNVIVLGIAMVFRCGTLSMLGSVENEFTTDGEVFYDRSFSPYGEPEIAGRTRYLDDAHVPPPDRYGFGFELIDQTCNEVSPCLSEATAKLTIRVREIEEPLPGDANLEGKVAFDDFLTVSKNFGRQAFLTMPYRVVG